MKTFAKVMYIILGVLMIAGGISCMFTPVYTSLMLGYIVGLSMIFDAVGRFIGWWQEKKEGIADGWMLAGAIISTVLGFFILNSTALQLGVDIFIVYYAAIWLLLLGIFAFTRSFKFHRLHKNLNTKVVGKHWYIPLCMGILLCVFGILCLFKPLVMASVIGVFIGLGIVSAGANMISIAVTSEKK